MTQPGELRDDFWCGSCSARSDQLDDWGKPVGWYRLIVQARDQPGPKPGWYCSKECLCRAAMIGIGCQPADIDEWLGVSR